MCERVVKEEDGGRFLVAREGQYWKRLQYRQ